MPKNAEGYGILVDYENCTGCHSCEVACKTEHNLLKGQYGIQITEIGPWQAGEDKWEWTYMPVLTNLCNMCVSRTKDGKLPSCVHHCQAWCMDYGKIEELAKKMNKPSRMALLTTNK